MRSPSASDGDQRSGVRCQERLHGAQTTFARGPACWQTRIRWHHHRDAFPGCMELFPDGDLAAALECADTRRSWMVGGRACTRRGRPWNRGRSAGAPDFACSDGERQDYDRAREFLGRSHGCRSVQGVARSELRWRRASVRVRLTLGATHDAPRSLASVGYAVWW